MKKLVKNIIGKLPFAAEAYWLYEGSKKPWNAHYQLAGLQEVLPQAVAEVKQYGLNADSPKKVCIFATLHYWIEQAGLVALSASADEVPANAGGGTIRVGEPRQALMLQGITSDSYQLTVRQPGSYINDMTSPISQYLYSLNPAVLLFPVGADRYVLPRPHRKYLQYYEWYI